ncbi:hypothetical protein AVEN_86302-1 [Araneus ventricosus]|uniref:Uncharacterized protein n=1 Tax=Araneus ventricosus TaxID=182803 RepID=A0A4Y2H3T9_ARAVE|nr:hypothetical protein AVEN_86302-1 [Araneus ventricosus]
MSGCQISKLALDSPEGIVMVGLLVSPPMIVRTSFGRGREVARSMSARTPASTLEAIAAAVIQMTRMPRQGGGRPNLEVTFRNRPRGASREQG